MDLICAYLRKSVAKKAEQRWLLAIGYDDANGDDENG